MHIIAYYNFSTLVFDCQFYIGVMGMTEIHNDLKKEQHRVNQVINVIKKKKEKLQQSVGGLKEDIIGIRKEFWEDVTVNFDEPDDIGETFTSIKQQAELLSERERGHRQFSRHMKNLERLEHSPYFGRVDFIENGEKQTEQIYLGITSLMDEKDENFIIYDWRAPISSLYYDYGPGLAEYDTPSGIIQGEMKLKRQFIIKNGWIKSMFETGVTIGDEILQEVLGNNANTQMKSIVSTIQKEQNQIIRNEKSKVLIVQGVAGSGKTSAALQRVAFLLYRYRKTITADNIMLFSPNSMFNSYVATVLPELGEENMQQTTFQAYLEHRLGKQYQLEDPFNQMEFVLSELNDPFYDIRVESIKYKAGLKYKTLIDKYVSTLNDGGIPFKDIEFRSEIKINESEINNYFYSLDKTISIPNRIQLVCDWLLKRVAKLQKLERTKDWVIEESELLDREDYLKVYQRLVKKNQFKQDTFDDYDREEKLLAKIIVNRHFKPLKQRIKNLDFIDVNAIYQRMLRWSKEQETNDLPTRWRAICEFTIEHLKQKKLLNEDATPYLYLQEQIEGKRSNTLIRHLFIDEAQDYSPFQFAFLRHLFPNSRMTILGDINQTIFAHALTEESVFTTGLSQTDNQETVRLMRSYRSTKEIVEFTKGLISGGEVIEAFNRHGDKPTVSEHYSIRSMNTQILNRIEQLKNNGHKTIAIICKTATESKRVFEAYKNVLSVKLVDSKTRQFDNGILIIPSYLAKGIEFDAVIIYNCSDKTYHRESERKLFYTACTRAMHELHLYSLGESSRFLAGVNHETYEFIQDKGE